MSSETLSSVSFYCQRCGKIQIFDVLADNNESVLLCENCSHEIGRIKTEYNNKITFSTNCNVCETQNNFTFNIDDLKQINLEKLFCKNDNFELGFLGKWEKIAEFLDYTKAEYDAIYSNDKDDLIESEQILLEAVNVLHDLVENKNIKCDCGNLDFKAVVKDGEIILECKNCKNYAVIPAKTSKDLERIQRRVPLKFFKLKN